METTNIEISKSVKCFVKQFGISKENVEAIAKQHNVKLRKEKHDTGGNFVLKCKITIGLIEVSFQSAPFLSV